LATAKVRLARETELQADLAARHQAADRRIAEARQTRTRHDAEAEKATAPRVTASIASRRSAAMRTPPRRP
jgi:hypothetical protein